ncbi:MAG: hypothetical protein J6Q61_00245 [Bacteroidales bacterium]|nr:hypothetical protein [Bacteroidales bacterium]
MKKEKTKKMLDDISQAVISMQQYEKYICSTVVNEVHMSKCIRKIAAEMGLHVTEKPWKSENMMATEISFVYKNVRFFELENFRKIKGAGAD